MKIGNWKLNIAPHLKARKIFVAALAIAVVGFGLLLTLSQDKRVALAATYTWVQSSWAGGATANTGVHPTNQSGWTQYSAKDANVTAGAGGVSLATSPSTWTTTTYNDFTAAGYPNGTVGAWTSATAFTTARYIHTSVAYNGYLYVIGGQAGTGLSDVQYAPINANGTVGAWTSTTALPAVRGNHTSVAYNGYLYVIGGYSGGSLNSVLYAPINANGTIGAWTSTAAFSNPRYDHTSVAYNGYLYVIGGYNDVSYFSDVQYAPINANGTVGAWVSTTAFPTARSHHTSVAYNGYLYVIGGFNGGNLSDVQYAPINANGTLGATWTSTTAFSTARRMHTSVAYNGYLYMIGGTTGSYSSDVLYAPINANGTVGAWASTTAFPTARTEHTSVAYNGYLYVIGGFNGGNLSDVQYAPISVTPVRINDGTQPTSASAGLVTIASTTANWLQTDTTNSQTGFNWTGNATSSTAVASPGSVTLALTFDVGTGADGAYSCTSGTCNLAGGEKNYTTFNISSGATVNVTGTTPLTIKATGDVTIAGTLTLKGGDGGGSIQNGTAAGGVGVAGGGNGGNGGNGQETTSTNGNGTGGGAADGNIAGGGGGGYGVAGNNGVVNGGATGGIGGCAYPVCSGTLDASLTSFLGGSGGGGGRGDTNWGGGGGGGGGGAAKITTNGTLTVSSTGIITANGGNGGNAYGGGGGGGGSGGALFLQGNTITISSGGSVTATGGSRGLASAYTATAHGGNGGAGRIRLDSITQSNGTLTALSGVTPVADYTACFSGCNLTPITSGAYTSAVFDTQGPGSGSYPNYTTVSWTSSNIISSTSIVLAACGMSDTGTCDGTGDSNWQTVATINTTNNNANSSATNTAAINALDGYRYIRYRATLSTSNVTQTPSLDSITINSYYW